MRLSNLLGSLPAVLVLGLVLKLNAGIVDAQVSVVASLPTSSGTSPERWV